MKRKLARILLTILLAEGLAGLTSCYYPKPIPPDPLWQELDRRRANEVESENLYRQGIGAYQAADLASAYESLKTATALDSHNVNAWMALGVVAFQRDEWYEAAAAFNKASTLVPERHEPHFNIGRILEAAGRYEPAITEYETALKLAPRQLEVMENLARCYILCQSKLDQAKELVDQCLLREQRPQWRAWLESQSRLLAQAAGGRP